MKYCPTLLVLGFMIIGLIMLSDSNIFVSAQNQTAGQNMADGDQHTTAKEKRTTAQNGMVVVNGSSDIATPGYVHVRSSRDVNASTDQTLEYFLTFKISHVKLPKAFTIQLDLTFVTENIRSPGNYRLQMSLQ
jgi:hypothetical protein